MDQEYEEQCLHCEGKPRSRDIAGIEIFLTQIAGVAAKPIAAAGGDRHAWLLSGPTIPRRCELVYCHARPEVAEVHLCLHVILGVFPNLKEILIAACDEGGVHPAWSRLSRKEFDENKLQRSVTWEVWGACQVLSIPCLRPGVFLPPTRMTSDATSIG